MAMPPRGKEPAAASDSRAPEGGRRWAARLIGESGKKGDRDRVIRFLNGAAQGNVDGSKIKMYANNAIKTSKYTWATFVPMNLFEQLHKFGNSYFLGISVIMYLGEKTPLFVGTIKAFSTVAVLMMMMSITGLMALLDDLRRKEADREINNLEATILVAKRHKVSTSIKSWEHVSVGDMLIVRQDEEFPADMVPFYCSGDGGNCYVSTANLDGETNLKLKTAPEATQTILGSDRRADEAIFTEVKELSGQVKVEAPNRNIHEFNGSLTLNSGAKESLCAKQLLLRGTVLRNTAMCIGIVVYCGPDTRMVRNSRPAPMKQSHLEHTTNHAMLVILAAQAAMAVLSSLCHELHKEEYRGYWYLHHKPLILPDSLAYWLTFFTLYSNLMPISLYPTAEFCNAIQAYFLQNDKHMFHKEQGFNGGAGFAARARSSNLCQELGQVSYIFSDKTGTLTQNVMELKRLSIAGLTYGELTSSVGFSGKNKLFTARNSPGGKDIDAFLEALSVAHTVMVSQEESGKLKYEAESPDEYALVKAAAELGWVFSTRKGQTMTCEFNLPNGTRASREYTVLATNNFTSARKRMSVVVQYESEYILFVKGADNMMLERALGQHKKLEKDLREFSRQGLRTLVIGCRRLSNQEVKQWLRSFDNVSRSTHDREQKLEEVAEKIERQLEILGASAIEDKLQDKVPETIEKFRFAGIKLWVLTGDKLETAREIGYATKVLTEDMNIQIIDGDDGVNLRNAARSFQASWGNQQAIMVTGKALAGILDSREQRKAFLNIAKECSVLIACRVSPMQKAEMVKLVREGVRPKPVTLAVGDGANDVPMIQQAQVGVGIAGREGRQSVNNSDFAIGQFKFLQRLLLVHGHWNYRRACKFTLFTFWRNMVQVLMIFYYTFISGYSGTVLFEDWIRLSFNVVCSIPILAVGCFDQDVTSRIALENPRLYEVGRLGEDLGRRRTIFTLLAAFMHSVILFVVTILAFPSMDLRGCGDYYTFGTMVYSCLIVDMNYRVAFLTSTHNRYTLFALGLSMVMYIGWLMFYPTQQWVANMLEPNMYMVPYHMVSNAYFWFCIIAVPGLAMVADVFITFVYHHIFPDISDKVRFKMQGRSPRLQEEHPENSPMLCLDPEQGSEYDQHISDDTDADDGSQDETSSRSSGFSDSDFRHLDVSAFAQQKLPSMTPSISGRFVACGSLWVGVTIVLIGLFALHKSLASAELRIEYAEGTQDSLLLEWIHAVIPQPDTYTKQDCDGVCHIEVTIPRDMHPPILVNYVVNPFYQNYNNYIKSEVSKELRGVEVSQETREEKCWHPDTRELDDGRQIVPCGMKATSVFNDTFIIEGIEIDRTHTAWSSDIRRYNNPEDYLYRANTSWLYERYPSLVSKEQGVKAESFATWMRPSAIGRVWKPYGYIRSMLRKNQKLQITINSIFPARPLGATKLLTLTENNSLGGHHDAFGVFLIACGILCFLVAMIVHCINLARPGCGDPAFEDSSEPED